MTKIDGRDRKTAAKQIDESLHRLQTDRIDLLQFHEIIRMSDPDRIFGPNGAIKAVLEAKEKGKIRYIGFTGHKSPEIHLRMLETAFAQGAGKCIVLIDAASQPNPPTNVGGYASSDFGNGPPLELKPPAFWPRAR